MGNFGLLCSTGPQSRGVVGLACSKVPHAVERRARWGLAYASRFQSARGLESCGCSRARKARAQGKPAKVGGLWCPLLSDFGKNGAEGSARRTG